MKKLLLTLGAVASVAAPVAAVVACSSDDSSFDTTAISAAIANNAQLIAVPANKDGNVGDAATNHPFRIVFTAEESKTLFGADFTTDVTSKKLMDKLNEAYAHQAGHGTSAQRLNTPDYAGEPAARHDGWNAFYVGHRKGISHHFGFTADAEEHVEIIANFRTSALAATAEANPLTVKALIISLLK